MSLTKFLQVIEQSPIGRFFDRKRKLIEQLNPERIYVENVRQIYNMPNFAAKIFCEMAVIEGIFERKIGIECPNLECGRIILSVNKSSEIPNEVRCMNCEILEKDTFSFSSSKVHQIVYYKLLS